ncbi:glycosyl hydrolases family 31-domain-containing protein [Kalaharituber pfeilii]|nr:glycosyl hydrolases family 31-domain-containing protein [Kalaharituber pfeilii]
MVKFSKGMWHNAPDTVIDWAVESWKAEANKAEGKLRVLAPTKAINHRGDILNCPTLTVELEASSKDVMLLRSTHWKARKAIQELGFELYPNGKKEAPVTKTEKTATYLALQSGKLRAEINTQPKSFEIEFTANSKLLTKLGWQSLGYIRKGTSVHPNDELVDPDKGERWMTYQLQLGVGEKIYGLGERFGPFVKNGQSVAMWNEDGGTSSELGYKDVPFYMSSKGYGIFIPSSAYISYEIQSERTTRVNIAIPGETLSMYLIYGQTPKEVLNSYCHITGIPPRVPNWSFGLWLSTSFTTNYSEETVNELLEGMSCRGIDVAVFHYDCFWMKGFQWCDFEFDPDFFPDPRAQHARLKEKGIKICVWINSYIAQESKLFDEGAEKGYFIKRKSDGGVWQWDAWQAGMALVDYTNPAACEWYAGKLKKLLDMGVDVFKTDFGERIPTGNVQYYDPAADPATMHNLYPFLYNKCVFGAIEEHYKSRKSREPWPIVFARSATAGGQRFPVHWGGDPMSTYEAMAETLRGGLSLGLCGFGYWAHDIGGFEGTPSPGLFRRWIAFGLLSSHSRLHGSGSFRAPWILDPSEISSKVLKRFTDLKKKLVSYIASVGQKETSVYGWPVMRAMLLEFGLPDSSDRTVWDLDTQYMLGPSLLVAPVFNDEGDVTYYLPAELTQKTPTKAAWYGLLDDKFRYTTSEGTGKWISEKHDFFSIPLLLRPGKMIVVDSPSHQPVTILYNDPLPSNCGFEESTQAVVYLDSMEFQVTRKLIKARWKNSQGHVCITYTYELKVTSSGHDKNSILER